MPNYERSLDRRVKKMVADRQWKRLASLWWGLTNKKNKFRDPERLAFSIKNSFASNFRVQLEVFQVEAIAKKIANLTTEKRIRPETKIKGRVTRNTRILHG